MSKVSFFYANGTAYLVNLVELGFSVNNAGVVRIGDKVLNPVSSKGYATIAGLDGKTATWNGEPQNDPFPFLLDPDVWQPVKISYPASMLGIGASIDYGINQAVKAIQALPPGTPFALGGYSQGAAVMSGVYNQIKNPAGALYSRRNQFLGGVCFGNPRRQTNFRGEVGGTWSGYWDDPNRGTANAAVTGGHGSFPASGPYARLSGCDPTKWIEFTAPDDIFSSTGDTPTGVAWTNGNDFLLGKAPPQIAGQLLTSALSAAFGISNATWTAITQAFTLGGVENLFLDTIGQIFAIGGAGHTSYPILGPPTATGTFATASTVKDGKTYLSPVGESCYQQALRWLGGKATAWATAPIVLDTNSTGWSTTLIPPAS